VDIFFYFQGGIKMPKGVLDVEMRACERVEWQMRSNLRKLLDAYRAKNTFVAG
jgi:hypothetical protein